MQYNKKNILFMVLAKYIRFLKELRCSYNPNIRGKDALRRSIRESLDLVTCTVDAQNFVEGRDVNIRGLYPSKFSIDGVRKNRMQLAFIDFLRERRAYENYLKYRGNPYTRKMALHEQVMRWVDICGFYWSETEEGYVFWQNISNAWKDFCITTPIMEE